MTDQEYQEKLALVGKLRQRASAPNPKAAARIRGFVDGLGGADELSRSPLDSDPMREEAEAARNVGRWLTLGSDANPGLSAVKKAGLLIPIIAGRNKVPKIDADLQKRALSAAQMLRAGKDEQAIWESLQVSPVARLDPSLRSPGFGAFAHEVSVTPGSELFSPYAAASELDKIDILAKSAAGGGGAAAQKVIDRLALVPSKHDIERAASRRWHPDPDIAEQQRRRARDLADAAPGGNRVVEQVYNLRANTAPLPVKGTVGSELDFENLAAQYPDLADIGFEAFQDHSESLLQKGLYSRKKKQATLLPGTLIGGADEGFDAAGVATHEVGHGVQQLFDAPGGSAKREAYTSEAAKQVELIARELRKSKNPVEVRLGESIARYASDGPYDRYFKGYGEVDARNMASRELLTSGQRAKQSPAMTRSVPLDQMNHWETDAVLRQLIDPTKPWASMGPENQVEVLLRSLRKEGIIGNKP